MAVQYNARTKTFRVTYKDFQKVALGKPYPYTSKTYYLNEDGTPFNSVPTKGQIRTRTAQLEVEALRLEELSKGGIEEADILKIQEHGALVIPLLEKVAEKPCISGNAKSQDTARKTIYKLITWLEDKAPRLTVYGIKKKLILRFFYDTYSEYMLGTLKYRKAIYRTAFKLMIERNELDIKNIFDTITTKDLEAVSKSKGEAIDYGIYDEAYIHSFCSYLQKTYTTRPDILLAYHLLITTGIRVGDITTLTHGQIDLEHRTITFLHNKTRNTSHAKTVIYITDKTLELLKPFHIGNRENFSLFHYLTVSTQAVCRKVLYRYFEEVEKPRGYKEYEQNGRAYSSHNIHGFRRTFITLMKKYHIDSELVRYIVGHTGGNIEERHYNIFQTDAKAFTEKPLTLMENIIEHGKKRETKAQKLKDTLKALNMTKEELLELLTK